MKRADARALVDTAMLPYRSPEKASRYRAIAQALADRRAQRREDATEQLRLPLPEPDSE